MIFNAVLDPSVAQQYPHTTGLPQELPPTRWAQDAVAAWGCRGYAAFDVRKAINCNCCNICDASEALRYSPCCFCWLVAQYRHVPHCFGDSSAG